MSVYRTTLIIEQFNNLKITGDSREEAEKADLCVSTLSVSTIDNKLKIR